MRIPASAFKTRSWLLARWRVWRRKARPMMPPNADAITPFLVVGGFIDAGDWRLLADQDVRVVVSLQAERHDEDAFGDLQPLGYLRLPTLDHSVPTMAQLRMGASFVAAAVDSGNKVLIHCHAGVGRSALLCACYLISQGMTVDEAWEAVKSKRTRAFLNQQQHAALEEFAKRTRNEARGTM